MFKNVQEGIKSAEGMEVMQAEQVTEDAKERNERARKVSLPPATLFLLAAYRDYRQPGTEYYK